MADISFGLLVACEEGCSVILPNASISLLHYTEAIYSRCVLIYG
jgi:hypothetical protein